MFAQQGTIDWTKLSSSTFSATVSILGRLSAHGLEPLTVAVAQAMFLQIPIGPHGEKALRNSMLTLKSLSSFGQVLWFGVGVRHILHTLVQTSQGAASVALAACLTETHSAEFSASVFYEIAKLMGSPAELSPSFQQWEQYVRVCSGIFADTHFAHRVAKLARLAGLDLNKDWNASQITEPRSLADLIILLGRVKTGQLESINVAGSGLECCWVACYCDFLLGLRVMTSGNTGEVISQNYDQIKDQAQVFVCFASYPTSGIIKRSQTISINPIEFLHSWAQDGHPEASGLLDTKYPLDQVIRGVFCHATEDVLTDTTNTRHVAFANVLAVSGWVYFALAKESRYSSPEQFVNEATGILPELAPLKSTALRLIVSMRRDIEEASASVHAVPAFEPDYEGRRGPSSFELLNLSGGCSGRFELDHRVVEWFAKKVFDNIGESCSCEYFHCCLFSQRPSYMTPIVLAHLLIGVICDDSLHLSRQGVLSLLEIVQPSSHRNWREDGMHMSVGDFLSISGDWKPEALVGTVPDPFIRLQRVLSLFSGREVQHRPGASAISSDGLYCYFDILRQPVSSFQDAARIHVGRGSIRLNNRPYTFVRDQEEGRLQPGSRISTMPENLECRALVDEGVTLRFWYERWDAESPNPQERDSLNPNASLKGGWKGDRGPWPGVRTPGSHRPPLPRR